MRIVLDIPEKIIPLEIKKLIESGTSTEKQHRQIIGAFLKLALEEIDECEVGINQHGLVAT